MHLTSWDFGNLEGGSGGRGGRGRERGGGKME